MRDETGSVRGSAGDADSVLRVLVSSRPPAHRVSYVDQLIGDDSAGGAPNTISFEYRDNLSGGYDVDVVHLIKTSAVVGDRRTPEYERVRRARRFAKALKRRRIALVRTIYGDEGTGTRSVARSEAILNQATTAFIVTTPTTAVPGNQAVIVIQHSHLRGRYLGYPRTETVPGRLLFVSSGQLDAAYEAPLKVFAVAELPGSTLRVVGQVPSAMAGSFSRTISRHPSRISLRDEAISDAARVEEVTRSELVVMASPDSHATLSTIMLAVSLDRPVLVEATAATRLLADEIGPRWVRLHEGRLTAATLEAAVKHLRADPPTGRPNLDSRDPNVIAEQYTAAFRAAAASR